MKITIAQLNPVVGDVDGNLKIVKETFDKFSKDSDLVVFPELFLSAYPPRDLLENSGFIENVQAAVRELKKISAEHPQTGLLLGAAVPTKTDTGKGLYNSALLIYQGKIISSRHKSLLPTYDVFDESRYFDPAPEVHVVPFKGEKLGVSVCEDAWNDPELWPQRNYSFDPIEALAREGATVFINLSASPFHVGKEETRYRVFRNHSKNHKTPFIYVNQVGANDELIFDGRSMFIDGNGKPVVTFPSFREHVQTIDTGSQGTDGSYVPQDRTESVYQALVLGIRDYMRKCGFSKAVIGLSGGIDSAVTCCLAKEALGSENLLAVSMPSPYSSRGSLDDSKKLAGNLGIDYKVVPISGIYQSYTETLRRHFKGRKIDVTEENLQARIRGNILMAFSNKFGYLLLSTGNKSEVSVGYCTLYGDMSGGLAVISDVPKTMVYELAHYMNRESIIIPREIVEKAPSAELKPDQKDQDTLPPYDILDKILHHYVDEGQTVKQILEKNFDAGTVEWVAKAVNRNEYKRRQAPPGLKITTKAFGQGRRMPIAAKKD